MSYEREGGIVSRGRRSVLIAIFGTSMIGIGLAGCSPLPGQTVDPLYLKIGSKPGGASAQTTQVPAKASPPVESRASATHVWVGRYRDSRGEGEIAFWLVRGESTVSGIWALRTGGGGQVSGVVEANGRRWSLRLESTTSQCPGTFEGWAEVREGTLVGAYHGKDCEGPVSDGWLELRPG